jgi:hypothetical protein
MKVIASAVVTRSVSEVFDRNFLAHASGYQFHAKSRSTNTGHPLRNQLALEAYQVVGQEIKHLLVGILIRLGAADRIIHAVISNGRLSCRFGV